MNNRKGSRLATVLAAALLLVSGPLAAQRITGQVSGTVKDETGAVLPGVTVSISGENIVGTQTTLTNDKGYYRIISLPPGVYNLSYQLDGFGTVNKNDLRVSVGASSIENVELTVGAVNEVLTITAEAPVIDAESNEVGVNFDRNWVENAPVQRLSFEDLVAAAPGSLRGGDDSGRTMVYGSSYDENSFQLDGADVNDNFFNEQLAEPNIDAIEEIEVLSLGAPAEYGNLTGAVYNIVTRQGTNRFSGDLNFFHQSDSLTEDNTTEQDDGGFPYRRDKFSDLTAQLGGPIMQDNLWFFLSYQKQEDGFSEVGVDPAIGTAVEENDRFFGKLNWQLSPSHKVVVTYNQDEAMEPNALSPGESPSTAWTRERKVPTSGLGYTGVLNDRTVLEARYSGFYADVSLAPTDPNQPRDLARFYDLDTGDLSGGHYYWYELEPSRTSVNAKVSHLSDDFLGGSHDFRFGVQYNESEAGGVYGYNDFILTYDYGGTQYGYGYTRVPFSYSGNTEAIGAFVDDTWRVNDRLTVNLGVRYDSNDAFSKAQDELDANLNPTGVQFPRQDHYTWEYISPRLGFNYQLTADGKTILKGHLGRYHRAIATGEFANVIGPSIKPIFFGDFDSSTGSLVGLSQISDNSNLFVDPNYKSPQTDQYILSLERQFGRNIGMNLNLVRKEGSDFGAWRDQGGIYQEVQIEDPDTGAPVTLFQLQNSLQDLSFVITNRDEMDTEITAVSLGFNKRMANNWSLNSSLTWLRSTGRTPDSLGGAGVQQRGGLQFRTFGRNPNDFVNSGGRLRGDVPWQFKGQFVYQLPYGFLTSANLSYRSGGNLVRRFPASGATNLGRTTILLEERGENGRLPSVTLLDLRLQKDFNLGANARISLIADIFNALNDDSYQTVQSTIVTSSAFNLPDSFVDPRRIMLGAKLKF